MSVPFQKTIFVIDAMAFRRARVESFLGPWAKDENVELISLQPEEAHAKLIQPIECVMLIYNVGAAPSTHESLAEMQVLHTLRPEAALAIVSDDQSPASVISAINCGARGYFSDSMAPDLALRALSFVLRGGTYFPLAILAGHVANGASPVEGVHQNFSRDTSWGQPPPGPAQQGQMSIAGQNNNFLQQQASLFDESTDLQPGDSFASIRCASISKPELTARQQAVLSCLCRGDPNKVIGRKLGMTETTVKVHVREIMRKLGVCNRTQVAIAAGRNGFGSDPVVELISEDGSPATIKSSVSHH